MKMFHHFSLFSKLIGSFLVFVMALSWGAAMAQDEDDDSLFMLDEIKVTAQFTETNLQETPIAITAVTGVMLEEQAIDSTEDLGLIIPNANIRPQVNNRGPNAQIGIRGVDQNDFVPAFEPGVGVYIDDIYQGTLMGSTLDLLDLERVEVLRGPQGTLFGKNSLGGAIRLISKVPQGDNTGHIQVTAGDYDRLDFSGAYDFSLVEDQLFVRVSGASKRIDGYQDRLDFTCQMNANGTPELAGSFPTTMPGDNFQKGKCKIGEKGGSQSDAAKIMFRYVPSNKLEVHFSADYTNKLADMGAESLLRGGSPFYIFNIQAQSAIIDPTWNTEPGDALTIMGNNFVTGDPYKVYESYNDPINNVRYPDKSTDIHTNYAALVDYDITDNINIKGIFGYREYEQTFTNANQTPFAFNGYFVEQRHDQTSYEVRVNGLAFDERLDWTTGFYYFESNTYSGGWTGAGTFGLMLPDFIVPPGWNQGDEFTNESTSFFAHTIFNLTDELSLTAGGRYTDESKTYDFDHNPYLVVDDPLRYGEDHIDWKLSLDYQFTDDIMVYAMASTGFRSAGANPRPFRIAQLQEVSREEILAYEIGAKTDFFDNRLRINAAAFINEYDPRLHRILGSQCTDPSGTDPGEYLLNRSDICPAGTWAEGTTGSPAFVYLTTPGTSKGFELDVTARPMQNLNINASLGYFTFDTDVDEGDLGWKHPDFKIQPELTGTIGVQYSFHFSNGSVLSPRIDMFYQGERSNGGYSTQPIDPYHVIPDYTFFNGRLTYVAPSAKWTVSLAASNLFDDFYWVALDPDRADDGEALFYDRSGVPSVPRMVSVTFRRNF